MSTELDVYNRIISRWDTWGEQSKIPDLKGKYQYFKKDLPMTTDLLKQSLETEKITIAPYCINNKDNTIKNPQIDIDNHDGKTDVKKDALIIYNLLKSFGAYPYIEASSGIIEKGVHIGIISKPISASIGKKLMETVLTIVGLDNHEVFPKQDNVNENSFGSLLKLPFQYNNRSKARSEVVNPDTLETMDRVQAIEFMCNLPETDVETVLNNLLTKYYEKKEVSFKDILPKIAHCIGEAYLAKWDLSGGSGDRLRLFAATELIFAGASDEQIHDYFKIQPDYDKEITQKKIEIRRKTIRDEKIKPTRCETIKKTWKIEPHLCINCIRIQSGKTDLSKEGRDAKESQAVSLIQYVESSDVELFHDDTGEPYARVLINDHKVILNIKSRDFKRWLTQKQYMETGKAPSNEGISSALNVIEAKACFDGKKYTLHNRVCWYDGAIWYDLGNWEAVKMTSQGWEIIKNPPILFKRYKHQKSHNLTIIPEIGDIKKVLDFLNIMEEKEKLLFVIYLVSCYIPDIPHAIVVLHGDKGAAKSTLFKIVKELVDPSAMLLANFPKDNVELVQLLSHHYFVGFDNVSYISDWQSDAICRASTGEAFSKRELYTDDEDVIYSFKRCVGLNGINIVATKADLLDRSVLLRLERVPKNERKTELEIWNSFNKVKGELLSGVFGIISKAIALQPQIKLDELPRMADFTIWGCAIAEAVGYGKDSFLDAYFTNIQAQNREAIESNPVGEMVLKFMDNKPSWTGGSSELFRELESLAEAHLIDKKTKGWPKAPQVLVRRLNEIKTNLQEEGISFEQERTKDKRSIVLKKALRERNDDAISMTHQNIKSSIASSRNRNAESLGDAMTQVTQSLHSSDIEKKEIIDKEANIGKIENTPKNSVTAVIVSLSQSDETKPDDTIENMTCHPSSMLSHPVYFSSIEQEGKKWEQLHHENITNLNLVKATFDLKLQFPGISADELANSLRKYAKITPSSKGDVNIPPVTVRFLKDMPVFLEYVDMRNYEQRGPFKYGDIVSISQVNAHGLIKSKAAEIVNIGMPT